MRSRQRNFYIVGIVAALALISCHPKVKMAAVKYEAADILALLNNPGDTMSYLTLEYLSSDGKSSTPLTLISYARNATGGFLNVPVYTLPIVDTAKTKSFEGKTILGNLRLSRGSIEELLTDSDTHRRSTKFDFLLFSPAIDKNGGYIYYDVTIGGDTSTIFKKSIEARPCPPAPNCPAHPN
ncbi:MAG: hypothetical protein ABIO82_00360 [Ginsengibacter sp.]